MAIRSELTPEIAAHEASPIVLVVALVVGATSSFNAFEKKTISP
jgi:hypothetical protein